MQKLELIKNNFPRKTKEHKQEIAIKNGWNTRIFQILRDIHDGNFIFKGKFYNRLTKPVEITYE